ncbi:DeoR/GlpR family DNA-binding transcription regulator [Leifsonia shinshuensis]|uniref:Lactose phosphotransferase system repressor n=1 Tax=Leifsonia shinshuensis TaxID=150026 RepID=A0A853CTM4_9MICO|nr:DeoR/GlpR family DNA-binding transcription regulator [Leifsonia shinshuensis]NYJ22544.1 DeoR/GlpR family transcriptional regulator of sugar metabolism [Leifsonia shinshuensis]
MNAETRQQQILEQLARRGEATIAELSARFDVSEMTIRRDLNQLAAAGVVVRTHGGAAPAASGSFEPPFGLRSRTNSEAKRQIAIAVAKQVLDGQTVILDGGTTGLAIAEELVGRNITVCALNLRVADILSAESATRVMIPGGLIRTGESSIVGSEAERALQNFRYDLYVMTASAVDAAAGFTEWNLEDAAIKRASLAASRRTIAAVDSSKFGREAFARICGLDQVAAVVTDAAISSEQKRDFSVSGTELLIA